MSWLLLLPFVLAKVNRIEANFWLILITFTTFSQLMTGGYQPTLVRNLALLDSGIRKLEPIGIGSNKQNTLDVHTLKDFLGFVRYCYVIIASRLAAAYFTFGILFVLAIAPKGYENNFVFSWLIFSVSQIFQYFFGFIEIYLKGLNRFLAYSKFLIASRSIYVVISVIGVTFWQNVMSLAISFLISIVISRIFGLILISGKGFESTAIRGNRRILCSKFESIVKDIARQTFLAQLASQIQSKGLILIAAISLGLNKSAEYSLVISFLGSLFGISTEAPKYLLTSLIQANSYRDYDKARAIYLSIRNQSLMMYFSGFLVLLIFGNRLLAEIDSSISLVDFKFLILLGVFGILEVRLNCAFTLISSFNRIDYMKSTLISSSLILLLTLISASKFGLIALIVVPLLVQIFFNFWYWPREADNMSHGRM